MTIIPEYNDIYAENEPYLRKNIVKGRYNDLEHYLDVQFRLLREDFLRPLREGTMQCIMVWCTAMVWCSVAWCGVAWRGETWLGVM